MNQDYISRLKIMMQKHLSSRDAQIDTTMYVSFLCSSQALLTNFHQRKYRAMGTEVCTRESQISLYTAVHRHGQ